MSRRATKRVWLDWCCLHTVGFWKWWAHLRRRRRRWRETRHPVRLGPGRPECGLTFFCGPLPSTAPLASPSTVEAMDGWMLLQSQCVTRRCPCWPFVRSFSGRVMLIEAAAGRRPPARRTHARTPARPTPDRPTAATPPSTLWLLSFLVHHRHHRHRSHKLTHSLFPSPFSPISRPAPNLFLHFHLFVLCLVPPLFSSLPRRQPSLLPPPPIAPSPYRSLLPQFFLSPSPFGCRLPLILSLARLVRSFSIAALGFAPSSFPIVVVRPPFPPIPLLDCRQSSPRAQPSVRKSHEVARLCLPNSNRHARLCCPPKGETQRTKPDEIGTPSQSRRCLKTALAWLPSAIQHSRKMTA